MSAKYENKLQTTRSYFMQTQNTETDTNTSSLTEEQRVKRAKEIFVSKWNIQPEEATEEIKQQEYWRLCGVYYSRGKKIGTAYYEYMRVFNEKPPFDWRDEWLENNSSSNKEEKVLAVQDSSTFQTQKERVQFAESVLGVPEKSPTNVHIAAILRKSEDIERAQADLRRAIQYLFT